RCNLSCPICLAKANTEDTPDLDLSGLADLLSQRRGLKIDLMAAEPTLRPDLLDWVRAVKAQGHIAALHTNGIKLADPAYVAQLAAAGVDEVFLQFDGFDEDANQALRGARLLDRRMRALANLRAAGIGTSLVVVIAGGLNEAQIGETWRFALRPENDHVRELLFLGLRLLGSARDRLKQGELSVERAALMPDDLIELATQQVPGVTRERVRQFNKGYFAMLGALRLRKCLYIQHYLVARRPGGASPVHEWLDLERLEAIAERYRADVRAGHRLARPRLAAGLARLGLGPNARGLARELWTLQELLRDGMNLSKVPEKLLLIGFITACDPANFDAQVAQGCGKGELSVDGGFEESGAVANLLREQRFEASDRRPGRPGGPAKP
ncbi:MAG: radical SAM protein, partial [Alphaproteobacteria bacterium]|nr:radical SAM protein [Alphaproteobacteria bacterium]